MTKKELQHLIIDYPENWVEINEKQFNKYLALFNIIGGENIDGVYSSVFERTFYYSPKIKDILEAKTYNNFYQCLIKDYVGGYAPYETPIRYKLNTNFEYVLRQVMGDKRPLKIKLGKDK